MSTKKTEPKEQTEKVKESPNRRVFVKVKKNGLRHGNFYLAKDTIEQMDEDTAAMLEKRGDVEFIGITN